MIIISALVFLLAVPSAASAHPLGNFSVNRLHSLTISSDRIVDDLVIDAAEIPTAQLRSAVDADGNGDVDAAERAAYAEIRCASVASELTLFVDAVAARLTPISSTFVLEPGEAGLDTSRLDCRLEASVDLAVGSTASPVAVAFADTDDSGRVGWNEINAIGDGVTLVGSPVPTSSVTDGLRTYPVDLLESPLDVRSVTLSVDPSGATPERISDASDGAGADGSGAASARDDLVEARPGVFDGTVGRVQDAFDDLVGRRDLTPGIGLLALGLALVLGASHALLPGHGKTVMAAYIAGRQGSTRDAVIVGATVTATHTGGVLLLGMALTVSSSLAGEGVLAWLGVISGLLIAALGVGLLVSAARHRDEGFFGHGHHHGPGGHSHGPAGHSHGSAGHAHGPAGHSHGPAGHVHVHHSTGGGVALLEPETVVAAPDVHVDHDHDQDHDQPGRDRTTTVSRRGLVGMGVAGGLVPSPSALIILLSAIALGRTWFGVLLVVGYGLGMAMTLTAAGILLVTFRDRAQRFVAAGGGRLASIGRRWSAAMPHATALLVLVVGVGLALRGLADV